uniref:Uncharacterized protein n=1 Tax=Anguilla anguilla TaxID=7936 RepID=A0A0E9QQ68_ANGAN
MNSANYAKHVQKYNYFPEKHSFSIIIVAYLILSFQSLYLMLLICEKM